MGNSATQLCSALQLKGACVPDPVRSAGAQHSCSVTNTGTDRYHVDVTVHLLGGSMPGASLALSDGGAQVHVLTWFAGVLGPSRSAARLIPVDRLPTGTASAHSVRTSITYVSDAECDPQDDQPVRRHSCFCTVDVSVL